MKKQLDRSSLGERLKEARNYRGFSQEEVASYVGISRSSISLIESGSRGVDTLELRKLAELYECSIDELVGETPTQSANATSIAMVARITAKLSPDDRQEVLRFAEFLRSRNRRKESA